MENNFELEEMKQQWSTLQTALKNQKEVNLKLILKDARTRISWNKRLLRGLGLFNLIFSLPLFISVLPKWGVPQPIYVSFILLILALSFNNFYASCIIKSPNDSNIDILKYSKSIVKFKKFFLWSEVVSTLLFVALIIWGVCSMGFDITLSKVMVVTFAAIIGAFIGIALDLKMFNNLKELQNGIDLIEN